MLTYTEYLRLPDLLDQQRPKAAPAVHDELLFITVHQTCELWFQQLLAELTDARDRMLAGEVRLPRLRLRRCHGITGVLRQHFDVLDTMPPQDFLRFRDVLGTASGAQSTQFREIELLSGSTDPRLVRDTGAPEAELARLRRRLGEPTVWDGYLAVLAKAGFPVATRDERLAALREVAGDRDVHGALWELAEALLEHDQAWSAFRFRHVLTVRRQLGARPGTGGSSGASHLAGHQTDPFYPELWELRTQL